MARAARKGWRYRAGIGARVLAAVTGGYGIPATYAFASARLLAMPRLDAVMSGTLLSFALMPAVVIGVFLARSARRAWIGILLILALLAFAGWWAGVPTA